MNITGIDYQKIIVWVLIWLFGYSLGLFEAWVKEKRKKKTEESKPQVIQAPPQIIEEDYALALFENNEQLNLKLDKAELNTPTDLNDSQRKRLIALVVKLRPWLEGKKSTPTAQPAQPPAAQPKPSPTVQPAMPAATPASTNIISQPHSIQAGADELEYSRLGMAGQINWILQKKLENHPLKARKIRLEGALTGGVRFRIGEESYEYVDDIPDPEIKALFKEVSAEWEKRSTPGL